jgi:hypothetical protein
MVVYLPDLTSDASKLLWGTAQFSKFSYYFAAGKWFVMCEKHDRDSDESIGHRGYITTMR